MKELKQRKEIRLKHFDYSSPGAYFITICTRERNNLFWQGSAKNIQWTPVGANCVRPHGLPLNSIGRTIAEELEIWHQIYENVSIQSYVIMPNHLHIMVVITEPKGGRTQFAPTVSRMVKQFKGAVTKKIGTPFWQKSFMEHIVRDQEDFNTRANYLFNNPLRWEEDELYN